MGRNSGGVKSSRAGTKSGLSKKNESGQNGLSYRSFIKTTPVLYGTITVNGKPKFGEFRSEYNPKTNKNEYRYYTLNGKKGQGGFTHDKAFALYKSGKLKTNKSDWLI
jgi:hypothetical protein